MNTKEQLNEIFRTDTDCLLADFPVGHKFIIEGKEAFVTDRHHVLLDNGDATYQYTIESKDGDAWAILEKDLWVKWDYRNTFMEIFRDADKLNTLSPDDRVEVFISILLGSSDVTVELLNNVLREYSVPNIEVREIPEDNGNTIFIIRYAYGGRYTGDNVDTREIEAKDKDEALRIFKEKYRYEVIYSIKEKQL